MSTNPRITGAGLCATSWSDEAQACRVSSQLVQDRKPQQNIFQPDAPSAWAQEELARTGAMSLTSLASVSWDDGNELRLFYLSSSRSIYEFVRAAGSTEWKLGTLHKLEIKATPGAGLAATVYKVPDNEKFEVRVYYQKDDSTVGELVHGGEPDDGWAEGTEVPIDALFGTELAAVVYPSVKNEIKTHLFYQTKDLELQEVIFEGGEGRWRKGDFVPIVATGRSPFAATTYVDIRESRAVQVYWPTPQGQVYYGTSVDGIWGNNNITSDKIPAGYGLAVIQWKNGYNLRLYYQKINGPELVEWESNDGAVTWSEVGSF